MTLTRYALDGGANSAAARRILPPEGLIRRAVNLRLRRDNELEQRPGFTALDMGIMEASATFTARIHDLFSFQGRLFGFGSSTTLSIDTNLQMFEFVGAAEGWRALNDVLKPLPIATDVRDVAVTPEVENGVFTMTMAANNGILVTAFDSVGTASGVSDSFGVVVRASDDATLVVKNLKDSATRMLRPVVMLLASGLFAVVGVTVTGNQLNVRTFDASTGEDFSARTILYTTDSVNFAAAAVLGAPGGYVTVGTLAGDLVIRHYNDSHVQQMTVTKAGIAVVNLAIAANGPQDRITVCYVTATTNVPRALTIQLTNGATVTGPTIITTPETITSNISVKYHTTASRDFTIALDINTITPRTVYGFTVNDTHSTLPGGSSTVTFSATNAQLSTEVLDLDPTGVSSSFAAGYGFINGATDQTVTVGFGSGRPMFFKDFGTATSGVPTRLGSHVQDAVTGYYYMTTMVAVTGSFLGMATEYRAGSLRRRQVAVLGGLALIANGVPLITDGRSAVESGWGEAPLILTATPSVGAGSVQSSAEYFVQVHAEWVDSRGNVHSGPVSKVFALTTGAADNVITVTVAGLHSLRGNGVLSEATAYRLVFFRTAALADGSTGENLYRETEVTVALTGGLGASIVGVLTLSDNALRAIGTTIYSQSQTPVSNQAPPPCRYVWPLNDRAGVAGLPRAEQILESKLLFPGEAVAFTDTDLVQYQVRASEDVLGIARLGSGRVAFTSRGIHLWEGEGPDHSGQGEFSYAGCLSSEGGLVDADGWRSLCETDEGTFFQREFDQICMLTKGGGVDRKVGEAVRDELVAFPVVVATTFLRRSHQVAFSVQNAAGNDGEVLVYDLRRKQWFVDDVGVVDALAEYQGRLVYCTRAGAVFQQDALPGTGAMPTQVLDTFDFDFGSGQSWGAIISAGMVGEFVADTTLGLSITYDSGLTYTAIGSWAVTAANGYSAGKIVSVKKAIPDPRCSRFGLRWTLSGSSGSAGLRINEIILETETAPGMSRLPARDTQ